MSLYEHARLTADMVPHLATLTRLALYAQIIVEFGVRSGVSTWALLDGLHRDGRMVSVDVAQAEVPERVWTDPRWTLLVGDDTTPEIKARLPRNPDVLLIDTSHEYHHTLAELQVADEIGARVIVLHDYNLPDVEDAVTGFCRRGRYSIAGIEPSTWGLAWLER